LPEIAMLDSHIRHKAAAAVWFPKG
jgi:hypothetical protein